jgi:hypothetical protein
MLLPFSLIIGGTTEKKLQFIKSLKRNYIKNFGFLNKKVLLNTTKRQKRKKIFKTYIIFVSKNNSVNYFRPAPFIFI